MMMALAVSEAEATNTAPPAIRISPRSPALPPSKSWFRGNHGFERNISTDRMRYIMSIISTGLSLGTTIAICVPMYIN
jgi:hypothetical protein